MKKDIPSTVNATDTLPDWYWKKGLHDSQIVQRGSPEDNCLELILDTRNTLFDTTVRALRFYYYKELSQPTDIEGSWWVRDQLQKMGKKYILEVDLLRNKKTYKYVIRFERCDVIRW